MRIVVGGALGLIVGGWPGGAVAAVGVWASSRARRRRRRPRPDDVVTVAARLLVMVGAGAATVPALEGAVRGTGLEAATLGIMRRARRLGAAAAFATATGPLAPLLHRLAQSIVSGAPVEPAIRGFIEAERRRRHTRAMERARSLPVRLMLPMTLLILPGFVLMVYGPALVGLVTDMLGPLTHG